MKTGFIITIYAVLALCPGLAGAQVDPWTNPAVNLLFNQLEPVSRSQSIDSVDPLDNPRAALARFYQCRGYRPAWVGGNGLLPRTRVLLETIGRTWGYGLDPTHSGSGPLDSPLNHAAHFPDIHRLSDARYLVRVDMALSEAILIYAARVSDGWIQPRDIALRWFHPASARHRDLAGDLAEALNHDRLEAFIASLEPRWPQYRELKKILERFRQIEAAGGWPPIPEGPGLQSGDSGERVALLRRHLTITGDLKEGVPESPDRFDADLEAAVKMFQHRHGLNEDGVVGKSTLDELNIPVGERIIQLELNLERWRWVPDTLGSRYLMVNIPAFELKLVDGGDTAVSMRTIVGREDRPTPVLSGMMTYLEINPFWNIPQKIAREDILPKIKDDPLYLKTQRIEVFDSWEENASDLDPGAIDWNAVSENHFPYRLRQTPAPYNALGRIKFMFPNPQSVYIHDTPGRSLFNKPRRTFSSGCVRVEHPLALAAYLLKAQGWNDRRLAGAVKDGRHRTVVLQAPIPVYLFYFTAWTQGDGTVHFAKDVYNRDQRLYQALLKGRSTSFLYAANDSRPFRQILRSH